MTPPLRSNFKYRLRSAATPTLAPLTTAIGGALAASTLQAATITVTTLDDGLIDSECSLRSALDSASGNGAFQGCSAGSAGGYDIIEFAPGLSGTIALQAGTGQYYDGSTLPIGESVRIYGDNRITLEGTGNAPVFYLKYDGGDWKTEHVRLHDLTITGGGGAYGGAVFSRAKELQVRGCTLIDNSVEAGGGAIWLNFAGNGFGRLDILNSVISNNDVYGANGRGGAIYLGGELVSSSISATVVSNNVSTGSGGGMEVRSPNSAVSIINGTEFVNNTAKYSDGGAINIVADSTGYGHSMNVRDALFDSNVTLGGNGGAVAVSDEGSGNNGFGNSRFRSFSMIDNEAANQGGALWIRRGDGSGTADNPENQILFEQSPNAQAPNRFSGNQSSNSAGAIYIDVGDATPVIISNTELDDNIAESGDGGAALISVGDSRLEMSAVSFDGNLASNSAGGARISSGGGIIDIQNAQFINNSAQNSYAGGLQIYGTPSSVVVDSSVIHSNNAFLSGGGLHLSLPDSGKEFVRVSQSAITQNVAGGSGGGIYLLDGYLFRLVNSTVSGNQASGQGGGIWTNVSDNANIKYSTVANNVSDGEGGGLYTDGSKNCLVRNSIFADNTGDNQDQDLRGNSSVCEVEHSLLTGKYSEFNNGTGNILYQNPLLQPLADNGGTNGQTHALEPSSPAIDAGYEVSTAGPFDQRGPGFERLSGSGLDMGAYERQVITDTIFYSRFVSP